MPQPIDDDGLPEGAPLSNIARHSVVLVLAFDDLRKRRTDLAWANRRRMSTLIAFSFATSCLRRGAAWMLSRKDGKDLF